MLNRSGQIRLLAFCLHLLFACASFVLVRTAEDRDPPTPGSNRLRATTSLEHICNVLGTNHGELAVLFGVRRQAVDQWMSRGVPAARQEKLATIGAIVDLLAAKLKPDRIPGVMRRPAPAYNGRSALTAIAADEQDLVLAELRDSFDWSSAA